MILMTQLIGVVGSSRTLATPKVHFSEGMVIKGDPIDLPKSPPGTKSTFPAIHKRPSQEQNPMRLFFFAAWTAAFASLVSADPSSGASCNSMTLQTCDNAGDQICCRTAGQPGTFATCDNDGDNFYIASCDPLVCHQDDDTTVGCVEKSSKLRYRPRRLD